MYSYIYPDNYPYSYPIVHKSVDKVAGVDSVVTLLEAADASRPVLDLYTALGIDLADESAQLNLCGSFETRDTLAPAIGASRVLGNSGESSI